MQIYENIKQLRIKAKLNQTAIAEILEIKQQQYQRYESGAREIPIRLLIKLADFYGVTLDYIVGREEPKNEEEIG